MNAKQYFLQIALPLYQRFRAESGAIKDVYAEPNIFGARVIDIDGSPESIVPILESAIGVWSRNYI